MARYLPEVRSNRAARRASFTLVVLALVGVLVVAYPLWKALFFAAVLAGALNPVVNWLSKKLWNRRSVAAGLMTFLTFAVVTGPVIGMGAWAAREGTEAAKLFRETVKGEGMMGYIDALPETVKGRVKTLVEKLSFDEEDLSESVKGQQGKAAGAAAGFLSATGSFLFQFAMMLVTLFALLMEGKAFVKYLENISPLPENQLMELLEEFRKTSVSVLVSSTATAGVQALAAMAGYFIAKVPHPIFLTLVTFFVAMIPAVGAASVVVAAAAYLWLTGHGGMALFLVIWGVVVVGLIDNIVKPLLVKRGLDLNGYVVLLALLGGIAVFGLPGLLLGPLAVAFFLAVMRLWQRAYGTRHQKPSGPQPVVSPAAGATVGHPPPSGPQPSVG